MTLTMTLANSQDQVQTKITKISHVVNVWRLTLYKPAGRRRCCRMGYFCSTEVRQLILNNKGCEERKMGFHSIAIYLFAVFGTVFTDIRTVCTANSVDVRN